MSWLWFIVAVYALSVLSFLGNEWINKDKPMFVEHENELRVVDTLSILQSADILVFLHMPPLYGGTPEKISGYIRNIDDDGFLVEITTGSLNYDEAFFYVSRDSVILSFNNEPLALNMVEFSS